MTRSFSPLAITHQHLPVRKVDVLDSQPQALHHAQPGAIEQARDQPSRARQLAEQPFHLRASQHHRQARRAGRPLHAVQPRQFAPQHLAVQEQDRRQRLVLRRGRDVALRREMIEKRRHLRFAHRFRVALAVEKDETLDPVHVGIFRAPAVVTPPDRLVHPVEQARAAYLRPTRLSQVL